MFILAVELLSGPSLANLRAIIWAKFGQFEGYYLDQVCFKNMCLQKTLKK